MSGDRKTTTGLCTASQVALWHGALWLEEVAEIHRLAVLLPRDPLVINIGSGPGTSTLAVAELRWDAQIYSVDLTPSEMEANHLEVARERGQLHQIGGGSLPAAAAWEQGPADWLFIDADHSYEGCRDDIAAWLPHLKPSGILLFHDYHPTFFPGVVDAVSEWRKREARAGRAWRMLGHVTTLIAYAREDVG
jgi:predicted O-methyltransferase YrrM